MKLSENHHQQKKQILIFIFFIVNKLNFIQKSSSNISGLLAIRIELTNLGSDAIANLS
jgi:hypothetical protein